MAITHFEVLVIEDPSVVASLDGVDVALGVGAGRLAPERPFDGVIRFAAGGRSSLRR